MPQWATAISGTMTKQLLPPFHSRTILGAVLPAYDSGIASDPAGVSSFTSRWNYEGWHQLLQTSLVQ